MIATHTPKLFNARIQSDAISARITGKVDNSLICSQTTNMRRELWAAPKSAAKMKEWREIVASLPSNYKLELSLPGIESPQLKQLLIPVDWRNDAYVCVTPVHSMGVTHEVYKRVAEQNIPYRKLTVQPTPAAISNHGESLLMQGGVARLLLRGMPKINDYGDWRGDFIQFTARCEGMNISSGMIALGFPAITAVGGFIHSLERKIGNDIEFAIGVKSVDWIFGLPRYPLHKTATGNKTGRLKGGALTIQSVVPGFTSDEMKGNLEIVLLLRTKAESSKLLQALKTTNRLAGGSLFDIDVSVVLDGTPPKANYLFDASSRLLNLGGIDDPLMGALEMYTKGGQWVDNEKESGNKWVSDGNGYTLNHTGYAFLETPTDRPDTRGNYPHAWAEATFSLINQGSMSDNCWWTRTNKDNGVFWRGVNYIEEGMQKKAARRKNVTGIKGLSIGITKNDRGYVLTRYCVNHKDSGNKEMRKSFYFGVNKSQYVAFIDACAFLTEKCGVDLGNEGDLKKIYKEFKHEHLL